MRFGLVIRTDASGEGDQTRPLVPDEISHVFNKRTIVCAKGKEVRRGSALQKQTMCSEEETKESRAQLWRMRKERWKEK